MKSSEKHAKPLNPQPESAPPTEAGTRESTQQSPEDERDLRDALRAREEARRKGVYPWEWVKQEIEG